MFNKATKLKSKLRLSLAGVSGSGKTFTALKLASYFGKKIAVIDTEHGSASKYSDIFTFDVLELDNFDPQNYIDGIKEAEKLGYDVLIIDSLTHAWNSTGGVLEIHSNAVARQKTQNSYTAWAQATPVQNKLVNAIVQCKTHLIGTMRAKTDYIQERNDNGKTTIKKVGLAPIQREGMEFEFDISGDMDMEHNLVIGKTRCYLVDGKVYPKPGEEFAKTVKDWLFAGVEVKEVSFDDELKVIKNANTVDDVVAEYRKLNKKYSDDSKKQMKVIDACAQRKEELNLLSNAGEDVPQ